MENFCTEHLSVWSKIISNKQAEQSDYANTFCRQNPVICNHTRIQKECHFNCSHNRLSLAQDLLVGEMKLLRCFSNCCAKGYNFSSTAIKNELSTETWLMYELKICRNCAHALLLTANSSNNKRNSHIKIPNYSLRFIFHRIDETHTQTLRIETQTPNQYTRMQGGSHSTILSSHYHVVYVYSRVPCEQSDYSYSVFE